MSKPAEKPRRGLWRSETVRAVLSGHSSLGIAFAAIIYVVCLTGTLSVFVRDWQRWEQPEAPIVRRISDASVARAITAMAASVGANKPLFVTLPTPDLPRFILSSGGDADDVTWIADAQGGLAMRQASPWSDFIVNLHTSLTLPERWGRFVVGLAGVALLSSLISGVLAHPRVFRDAFHLRFAGSRRLEQADLHNRLGVWPLPFHLLISLTGALLGLSTLIVGALALLLFRGDTRQVYRLLNAPPPAADARPAPVPDMAALIAIARAHSPGAEPRQITVTGWGRRDMRIEMSASRPRFLAMPDELTFDTSARVVSEQHPTDQNVGTEILGGIGPLHFGWFGGFAIRIAYGLLGLALCVVTVSGINVWLARRRDKGRPAPALERAWAAIVWGQPLVLATCALLTMLRGFTEAQLLGLLWAGATILLPIVSALLKQRDRIHLSRLFRSITAAVLLAITLSASLKRPIFANADALAMTALILVGGVMFALVARPNRRRIAAVEQNK